MKELILLFKGLDSFVHPIVIFKLHPMGLDYAIDLGNARLREFVTANQLERRN